MRVTSIIREAIKIIAIVSGMLPLQLSAGATAKKASDVRIVFVVHGQASDTYWSTVKRGEQDAQRAMGAQVEYVAPDVWDVVKMSKLLDAAIASKPDGLVVTIPDVKALGPKIRKASDLGIPVIVIDTGEKDVATVGARLYVGAGSQRETGKQAGLRMKAEGVTHAVCINHEVGNVSNDDSCLGFQEGIGTKVDVLAVNLDPTEIKSRVKAYFNIHREVTGAITVGPAGAIPTLEALRQRDLLNRVKLATFNLTPEVLDAVSKNQMSFAIDQQQYLMGYLPVVYLTLNAMYGTMPTANVYTGPVFVTRKEAGNLIDLCKRGIR